MSAKQFFYGGQAVIEVVMMRGAHKAAIAVRDINGKIHIHEQPLNATLYRGRITRTPFLRGLIGLWDALGLGTKALMWSAEVAITEEEKKERAEKAAKEITSNPSMVMESAPTPEEQAQSIFTGAAMTGVMVVSLGMGIGLFFVLPVVASSFVAEVTNVESNVLKNVIEEIIKIGLFLGYLGVIGQMEDVKRLFRYHGAEHKTINAYEAGAELKPEVVITYPIEHPRCGTAFLLNVIILSIIVNSIVGRPDNLLVLAASRILAIPIVAGIAYEWLRFTAKNTEHPIIGMLIKPNLALQRLTTREPDLEMCEVAIQALEKVLVAEGIQQQPATGTSAEAAALA